ncbi:MAG: hypothetical protein H6Q38_433 [Chloroflexi bacterium]|nr:hypothetical protein [Chloroflexota bacterium]
MCGARLEKRKGAAHLNDPKSAYLSLKMATKETLVGSAYNVDHSNSGDMGDSHQVTGIILFPAKRDLAASQIGNGYWGISRATGGDGIRRYRTGVKREPKLRCKGQTCEPGKSDHPSGNGLDWLRLKWWSDGGVAVVVNSGRENLPHGEGQQLNKRSFWLNRSSVNV